jgi:hypothetical protein
MQTRGVKGDLNRVSDVDLHSDEKLYRNIKSHRKTSKTSDKTKSRHEKTRIRVSVSLLREVYSKKSNER